jgi:N-acetylglutamate synthase-like GNAT family acetyltransferase
MARSRAGCRVTPPDGAVTVRPAGSADAAAVSALVESAYRGYVPRIGLRPAPMDADYASLIARDLVWVAEHNGAVVGVLVLIVHGDHLLLENIAVSPASQGAGVGSLLMRTAEQRAREAGVPEVRLYTHELMTENHAYYRHQGFVETHRAVDDGVARVFFTKRL